jgi:hypothetical protein
VLYRLIGFWVLRRAYRIVTADDPRSLSERLGAEGKRILMGAAITLAVLILGTVLVIAALVAVAT